MKKTLSKALIYAFIAGCGMAAALLSACSNIDEADRLIYVEPIVPVDTATVIVEADSLYDAPVAIVPRRVLIEDHTGQLCPNCPDAARQIHEYQNAYGSLIVPVAIHSKAQGIMEPEGLATELGNRYYNYWHMEFKPVGLINRLDGGGGKALDKTIWSVALNYALSMTTPLDIRVKARQNAQASDMADIDVKVILADGQHPVSGKLQVWITEDGIVARQDDGGTIINDYVHDHVLRAAVNGDWGEDVSLDGLGYTREQHYTATLKPNWNADKLNVVAFVYTDDEVLQAVSAAIKTNN